MDSTMKPRTLRLRSVDGLSPSGGLPPPTASREGSLTTVVFWFSGTAPDEPTSGCCWTSYSVNFVMCFHLSLEQRFHLTSSLFLFSERHEPIITPWFAPIQFSGARGQSSTRLDLNFSGGSPLYSYPKVVFSSTAWILLNGYIVLLQRSFSNDLFHGTVGWPRSGAAHSEQFVCSGLTFKYVWAWPIRATKPASTRFSLIRPKFKRENAIYVTVVLGDWVNFIEISRISSRCILPYLSFGMNLLVGLPGWVSISPSFSCEKSLLPSLLLPLKGDVFSVSLSRYSFSFLTSLSSCVAVCTGPKDTIESTTVFLVGENWLSTSPFVTIFQLSDFLVKALSTQSNLVLILLSSSLQELSSLAIFTCVVYAFNQRGCRIPSCNCNRNS